MNPSNKKPSKSPRKNVKTSRIPPPRVRFRITGGADKKG